MKTLFVKENQPPALSLNSVRQKNKSRKKLWIAFAAIIFLVGDLIAIDLWWPRSTSLRQFEANEVARLETAMWRSYYDKERFRLFRQLAELMRTQYRMPFFRSNVTAYQAARAAFVFKAGHNRNEYDRALPNLVNFYRAIHQMGDVNFEVERAAKLELEWWIIHRERKQYGREALDRSLAELAAEIYRVPVEQVMEHARLRAEAMLIRDDNAEQGGVTDADWQKIDELLHQSWQSLYLAVRQ